MTFKDLKLTEHQALYLTSVVVPRWVNANSKNAAHIWFELFLEHLDKMGYTIVKKDLK